MINAGNGLAAVTKRDDMAILAGRKADGLMGEHELGSEQHRLLPCPVCQLTSANAACEAQIVADQRAGAGLATDCHLLDYHGVQTFGSSIHGGCQPGWSSTQNRQIVDLSGRLYLNAVCAGNLGEARIVQH
jgi:hypothetical protein